MPKISEIKATPMFSCPVCGHVYKTEEEARNCAAIGVWNSDFDSAAHLWCWNIFKPSRDFKCIVAIIPEKINPRYDWDCRNVCHSRRVSLFSAFSNDYWVITNQTKIITLGILEGFERYRLIPPVQYMHNIPDEKAAEIAEVLRQAFALRKHEFVDGHMSIARDWEVIAAYEFEEFTRTLRLASGKETPPLLDTSFLPPTSIISSEKFYNLEKYIPELSKELEW